MKPNDDTRRPEEIESEIESTRAEMDHTLEAIQRKFSPGQLLDQTLAYFREGPGEFGSNLGTTIKQNPVPVTLVGLGLTWLMAASWSAPSRVSYSHQETSSTVGGSRSPSLGERLGEGKSRVAEGAGSARHKAEEAAGSMRHTASEAMSGARHQAGQIIGKAQHQTERLGHSVHQQTQRIRGGFQYLVQEQPLVLGALGMAVGAALGAGLPRTRQEDELMGETRDDLVRRAEESGREQLHKAQRVTEATWDAAKEEADKQGLTREGAEEQLRQAQSKAQSVAEAARDTAKKEADKQGFIPQDRGDRPQP